MGARTGQRYLESIRANQPEVWLDGQRIEDLTTHPVFIGPLRSLMEQYDLQHDPRLRDICLYESPTTGDLVSSSFMVPRSREELIQRRRHFKIRADHHFGTMGRAPDFMNAFATSWLLTAGYYASANPKAGDMKKYAEYLRENDLYMTHVLVNPQTDRSRTSANQEDPFLHLGRVGDTSEGIIIRGAKMLGTMAPLTEELLVTPFGGIAPGDDAYALVLGIPSNTKGVKFICRESFSGGERTLFDHPFSSRFEEMDCIAIFDDVLVPWDRVFVDGSPGSGAIVNGAPPAGNIGISVQVSARTLASLELLCGVAIRMADAVGITGFLHVQEKLGYMLLVYEHYKTAFYAADALATELPDGTWAPYGGGLLVANLQASQIHTTFVDIIHTLGGGGFFYAPSKGDFDNPQLRPYIDKYVRGRPGVSALERTKLFKLAWDLTGDAFGQRFRQYVKYYSGDPVRNIAGFYLGYDKSLLSDCVDRVMAGSDGQVPVPPVRPAPPARRAPSPGLTGSYPAASHPVAPGAPRPAAVSIALQGADR